MAITYGFFNSLDGDRMYNADQMSKYFKGLVSDGVYEGVGGALQVIAGSGMNVNVKTGRAIIDCKWLDSDAVTTLAISAAHVTLNRYTAVIVRLDMTNRLMTITTKDGTPATTPTRPTMTNSETIKEICLAYVYVAAGATSITQQNITDMRASSSCGWVTGLIQQVDTSELFLQWQDAYATYYETMTANFEAWFATLTQQLNVNTYIQEYVRRDSFVTGNSKTVSLNMTGYTYDASDIIQVFINGLLAVPNTDYTVNTGASPVTVTFNFALSDTATVTEIKVLKSRIGFYQA